MDTINRYFSDIRQITEQLPAHRVEQLVDLLFAAWLEGRRIFICGNGGSAATASHFACDLGKGTIVPGKPRFQVISLTDNVPLLTAWANDSDYTQIFAEQLVNLVQASDIVIGISGSGNSPNVINAMCAAQSAGAITVGLTGFEGGKLKSVVDHCLIVPSHNMAQIEDIHLMLEHCICASLRERIKRQ